MAEAPSAESLNLSQVFIRCSLQGPASGALLSARDNFFLRWHGMRVTIALVVSFCTGVLLSGCTVAHNAADTLVVEPIHFPNYLEKCLVRTRTEKLADDAWQELTAHGDEHSKDFHRGFRTGFSDYLQFGGKGEPPPVPPRFYWDETSPAGRQASQDWFAGFRRGASMAKATGYRELILVPASGPGLLTPSRQDHARSSGALEETKPPHPFETESPFVVPPPTMVEPAPLVPLK